MIDIGPSLTISSSLSWYKIEFYKTLFTRLLIKQLCIANGTLRTGKICLESTFKMLEGTAALSFICRP